jgi:MYXO-CTERM domain-containing protein
MLFGWPDLYGFGNYCIMGNASDMKNPVGINDFYRADQGWIPIIDIDESTNVRYRAVPDAGGYRYLNPNRPDEAFFWSNVQATNRWSTLRGSGLVLLHFDYAIRNNDPPNPLSLAVVQADGLRELDETQWPSPGSDAEDFFHSETNTEFSSTTVPASLWNDGSESGLRIYEISADGTEMTFAVGHGTPDPGVAGAGGVGGVGGIGGMGGLPASAVSTTTGGTATTGASAGTTGTLSGSTGAGTLTGNTSASGMSTLSMSAVSGSNATGVGGAASITATTSAAVSSSLGGAAALSSAVTSGPTPGPQATEPTGCACRLEPASGTRWGWLLSALAGLVFLRRRQLGTRAQAEACRR